MKFSKLFKKAAALCMAAVTALSLIPATTAFAAGDIGTISFSHTYDSRLSGLPCFTVIRATAAISREAMMRNGLPPRPLYGSSSRDAVKPQAPTARQARQFTACILALTMPTAGRGRLMTRLFRLWQTITPYRAFCRAVKMTLRRSLPIRTGNTALR